MKSDGYLLQYQINNFLQVFDEDGKNRTYGFVDYVTPEGAQMAMQQKSILMPPGQYIKVLYDDKQIQSTALH